MLLESDQFQSSSMVLHRYVSYNNNYPCLKVSGMQSLSVRHSCELKQKALEDGSAVLEFKRRSYWGAIRNPVRNIGAHMEEMQTREQPMT